MKTVVEAILFSLSLLLGTTLALAQGSATSPGRAALPAPAAPVEVPLRIVDEQPAVEVLLEGQGPFVFLIDTGAAGAGRISPRLAERFGYEKVAEVVVGDPSGRNRETRDLVGVGALTVAGLTVEDVPMLLAGDMQGDRDLDGILGFALFEDVLLGLDYPGEKLRLEEGELPLADGEEVLDFDHEHGIPSIEVDVGGVKMAADIDSGSMGWVMVPESVAEKLDLAGEPRVVGRARTPFNTFDIKQAPLNGTVRVGRHALPNPPVDFAGLFPRGNLGGQLLRHFALTFDQKNGRVRFQRDGTTPLRQQASYRVGVMFVPSPEGLLVDGTVPGSPGERAGLTPGDLVLRINGTPVAELGRDAMGELFGTPHPIALEVRRSDETLELRMTPEKVGG